MGNFAKTTGPQLNGAELVIRRQPKQGQRNTNVIIEIAFSHQGRPHAGENGPGHFTNRGFATAAGNRHQPGRAFAAIAAGQIGQGLNRIANDQLRNGNVGDLGIHYRGDGALCQGLAKEFMTIKPLTAQSNKQLPISNRSGIGGDAIKPEFTRISARSCQGGLKPLASFRQRKGAHHATPPFRFNRWRTCSASLNGNFWPRIS